MKKVLILSLLTGLLSATSVQAEDLSYVLDYTPNLAAWYDANDLSATLNDGDVVTTWPNKVPGTRSDGVTTGDSITYLATGGMNGRPGVLQSGVKDALFFPYLTDDFLDGRPWTIFIVTYSTYGGSGDYGGIASPGVPRLQFRSNTITIGDPAVALPLAGGQGLRIARLDGTLGGSGTLYGYVNDSYQGSVDTTATGGLIASYGGSYTGFGFPHFADRAGGRLSEMLVFNRALDDHEINAVAYYLTQKYDLTAPGWTDPFRTLTVETNLPEAAGRVVPAVGTHTYINGQTVALSAAAGFMEGSCEYEFSHWSGNVAEPTLPETTIIIEGDQTVVANYVKSSMQDNLSELLGSIPDFVAWYDAADLGAALNNGDVVTTWPNKIPGTRSDGITTNNTITYLAEGGINGRPAVHQNGMPWSLQFPYLTRDHLDGRPWTIFIVTYSTFGSGGDYGGISNPGVPRLQFRSNGIWIGDDPTVSVSLPGGNGLRIARLDGTLGQGASGTLTGYYNDQMQVPAATGGLIVQYGGTEQHYLGFPQYGDRAGGRLSEMLVFNRALGAVELNTVAYYLTEKYELDAPGWTSPFRTLTVESISAAGGRISPDLGDHLYLVGQTVEVAAPRIFVDGTNAYEFTGWSGNVADLTSPFTSITLAEDDETITAHYTLLPPSNKMPFKTLYNNDLTNAANCISPFNPDRRFTETTLRGTIDDAAGFADVHLLSPGTLWIPLWPSEVYPADEHYQRWAQTTGLDVDTFGQFCMAGGDAMQIFIDRCRQTGQIPFVSFRLNDPHNQEYADDFVKGIYHPKSQWICDFYLAHLDDRLGDGDYMTSFPNRALNWVVPEVRQYKYDLIEELCENYDFDGLELDFLRWDAYFRTSETTQAQRETIMTAFIADVRALLDRTAKPGQHRWLGVRVPCYLNRYSALGINLPAVVAAGVDFVNLSASYPTVQQTDLPQIRSLIPNTAIYLEQHYTTWVPDSRGIVMDFFPTTDNQYYTTSHLAYQEGVDGISLFNFQYYRHLSLEPPFTIIPRLRDPQWLAERPQQWYMEGDSSWRRDMPRTLSAGQTYNMTLKLYPTASLFPANALLRLCHGEYCTVCDWTIRFNGVVLERANYLRSPIKTRYDGNDYGDVSQWACFVVPRNLIQNGTNTVSIQLNSGGPVTVRYYDLVVSPDIYIRDYHPDQQIDLPDLVGFSEYWMSDNCHTDAWCQGRDLNQDNIVNAADFAGFADYWLAGYGLLDIITSIPNLIGWYKADSLTGLTDGQTVSNWPNSGYRADSAVATSGSPVYRAAKASLNNMPTVEFYAGDEMQISGIISFLNGMPFTIFLVSTDNFGGLSAGGISGSIPRLYCRPSAFQIGTGPITVALPGTSNAAVRVYQLSGQAGGAGLMSAWENGVLAGSANTGSEGGLISNFTTDVLGWPFLGKAGTLAEVIVYDRALDAEELNTVGYYLSQKYGIATTYTE